MSSFDKVNILLVDDNHNNLVALSAILSKPDYNLILASSGREALLHILKTDFAVILLDVMMPGMDGYEVASFIKERESSRDIPILFLTAIAKSPEQIQKGYAMGAVDYLEKPIDSEVIKWKVAVFVDLLRSRIESQKRLEMVHLEEILSFIAHDLRTPLTAITLNSELLQQMPISADRAGVVRFQVKNIIHSAFRMEQMIQDLLDSSKIGAGKFTLKFDEFSVTDLIHETLDTLKPLANAKSILIETELEPENQTVYCDRVQILRVLNNLINNSIKFTPPSGKITVRASRTGDSIQFSVIDGGVGLSPEEQAHVFERFWQKGKTAHKGTGLGLYIVKCIIEAHGKTVGIKSELGKGATFYFTLPSRNGARQQVDQAA